MAVPAPEAGLRLEASGHGRVLRRSARFSSREDDPAPPLFQMSAERAALKIMQPLRLVRCPHRPPRRLPSVPSSHRGLSCGRPCACVPKVDFRQFRQFVGVTAAALRVERVRRERSWFARLFLHVRWGLREEIGASPFIDWMFAVAEQRATPTKDWVHRWSARPAARLLVVR
jgi:hypothetical protein